MFRHRRRSDEEVSVFFRVCFWVEGGGAEEAGGDDAEGGAVPKFSWKFLHKVWEETGWEDDPAEDGVDSTDDDVEHQLDSGIFVEDSVDGERDKAAGKNDGDEASCFGVCRVLMVMVVVIVRR